VERQETRRSFTPRYGSDLHLDNRQFPLRSLNISESGYVVQGSADIEVGQEVGLEFKIADVSAALKVVAGLREKKLRTG